MTSSKMTDFAAPEKEVIRYFSGSERVTGWFYAAATSGRAPAVVICPGFSGSKYAAYYQAFAVHIAAAGISVLLIDYRGWGDSEGERGRIIPLEQVEDIRNGLTFLETRGDVDRQRLGLLGASFGGAHVMHVAATDVRVRAGVSVVGAVEGESLLRRNRREYEWDGFLADLAEDRRERVQTGRSRSVPTYGGLAIPAPERQTTDVNGPIPEGMLPDHSPLACAEAILEYKPLGLVPDISPRAMLWIAIEHDVIAPAEGARCAYELAGPPKKLVVLPGGSHYGAYTEHRAAIVQQAVEWYNRYLHPAVPAAGNVREELP